MGAPSLAQTPIQVSLEPPDSAALRFAADEIRAAASAKPAGSRKVTLRADKAALAAQSYHITREGESLTVMQKQWLSFALWGRLAYDPDLPDATFQRMIAVRFPGADEPALTAARAAASKTFP